MIKKSVFVILLFFIFISSAKCETQIPHTESNYFYPVADTYVHEKNNATSVSDMELRVGYQSTNNFGNMKSAIKFDISAIPENSIVNEAYLYVYSFDTKPSWDFNSIQAYSAPNNWSESSIDWSQLDDRSAQIHESSFISGIPGSSPDSYSWDITNMVQSWINGKTNFGIVLQCDSKNFNDYIIIYSSNNLIFQPYLNVSYTPTEPPLPDRLLPVKTHEKTNRLTVNKPAGVENLVKTNKIEESNSETSLHQADPTPVKDAPSNIVQTAEQTILPEITRQPQSQLKNPGTPVTFSVTALEPPPLSFQWQKNGVDIDGETSKSFFIDSICENDKGLYSCNVSNAAGSVTSDGAELFVNDPAVIIKQPLSQSKKLGEPVAFSVATTGKGPLSFQWKKDHINIHSATSESFTIAALQKNDEGIYTCVVRNTFSNDISNEAMLVVLTLPQITQHPLSKKKNPGISITFSITVSGMPPVSYQWLKDGAPINNAVADSYTIDSISENDEGYFTCRVTNDAGSLVSNAAKLSVNDPPNIFRHPLSQTRNPETSVTFSVIASGTPPISYQWMKDESLIDNAIAESYTIDSVSKTDEGTFVCRVTNKAGSISSSPAVLSVNNPVKIIKHPQSLSKSLGEPVIFSVQAAGTSPLSFQWEKDSLDILGATAESYTITSVQNDDRGVYKCKVSNDFSNIISNSADLILKDSVQISRQPQSQLKNPDTSVTFSVTASGTPPLSFQWQKDGVYIDGATSKSFTIDSISENDEGFYSCNVSNDAGSVTSDDAELSVSIPVAEVTASTVTESAESDRDKISKLDNLNVGVDVSHKPTDTIGIKPSALTGTSVNNDTIDSEFNKQPPVVFKNLSLKAPVGQEAYVHNGNTLTYKGFAFPNAALVSARLEDDQGRVIRDASKGLKITPDTGDISGSIFVGSFRGAETVHLKIKVQAPASSQSVTGTSNTLFIDQGYPKVRVTEPANHASFKTAPIVIYGTASDDMSGIVAVEISTDGGLTYCSVDFFRAGHWRYSFTPTTYNTEYNIKVRSTDIVGLATVSDNVTIHYNKSSSSVKKITKTHGRESSDNFHGNTDKPPGDDGICTYRIISLSNNRFQPTDLFTLKEQMAIIVKGYGGNMVTIKIIAASSGKVVFELSDYIPANKYKMWEWKLSQPGIFQATLFVDGTYKDDIFFKIIQ